MTKNIALVILALLSVFMPKAGYATTTPLIADLSTNYLPIDSTFSGTHILLFGARNEGGDVVVVLRGHNRTFTVRKKKRIAGIWVNRDAVTFRNTPMFYAVGSTKPLQDISAPVLLEALRLGSDSLLRQSVEKTRAKLDEEIFSMAFIDHQRIARLYHEGIPLQFMGETLFKANIELPDTINEGNYVAEAYLISGNELVGMQSIPLQVQKSGLDARIYTFAHESPAMYGLFAVALAVAAGWIASQLFQKI